jgi:mRNA-degrading endonuclease RelE of RelBE toxin-antitoxin system
MPHILLRTRAIKQLDGLSNKDADTIRATLDELAAVDLAATHVKKLREPEKGFRKRVGEYRVMFEVEGQVYSVYSIVLRKDAYR